MSAALAPLSIVRCSFQTTIYRQGIFMLFVGTPVSTQITAHSFKDLLDNLMAKQQLDVQDLRLLVHKYSTDRVSIHVVCSVCFLGCVVSRPVE